MIRNYTKLTCLGVLAMLVACGDSANDVLDEEPMTRHLLASIALSNESRVEFHEPMPGELVLLYTGKGDPYREMFAELERGAMTHVELYEAMSGEAAPPVLVEAEGRALAARAQAKADLPTAPEITSVHDPLLDARSSKNRTGLTADEFIVNYCPGGWDFLYCWTSRTGDYETVREGFSMHTHLNAYLGSVVHELDYWTGSSWIPYSSLAVPEGYTSYLYATGKVMWRRIYVGQADGAGYHLSAYGLN